MSKIDFKKELRHLYLPQARDFVIVDVPPMNFIMIDGHGDPNTSQEYSEAVEALYAVAFKVKFRSKKQLGRDYVVSPLEGLWWAQDMAAFAGVTDKGAWDWTMMILTPEWVGVEVYEQALTEAASKRELSALSSIRLESYDEGLAVQTLHVGSYDEEAPILARLHDDWIPDNGYVENGKHHEIYLSDPRRVEPSKLKTVLRQPIRKTVADVRGVTQMC
jgi:hypothetical protein